MTYALSALLGIVYAIACCGFVIFASILTNRAFDWNDERRERAALYRDRARRRHPAGRGWE
jgi:hypothetical protein